MGGGNHESNNTNASYCFLDDIADILSPQSPLFTNIDSLTSILLQTDVCPYLPKLYGVWKTTSDIAFDMLPNAFVLKTNHDCGGVVIVPNKEIFLKNKDTYNKAIQKLHKHLTTNYYNLFREWHYKDIQPKLFAEELAGEELQDYRFHIFGGKVAFIQVANSTHTKNNCFDTKWNLLPFTYRNQISQEEIPAPKNLKSMIEISSTLGDIFDYVRVDLFCVGEKIFVGELTFTPNCGTAMFDPSKWDKYFGTLWKQRVSSL